VEKITFSVFPNPSTDVVYVTGNKSIQSLSLVSTTGHLLQTVNNTNSMQLVDFPAGTYFLVVSTGTQQVTKRIIKK
uniref:T9SS type A sorting domain-containing protein n=1 Tax=Fluviicola sp. TaxID=1917219 RepID=UPI004049C941